MRDLDNRGYHARINGLEADLESSNRKISHLIEVKEVKEQENVSTQQRIAKEQLSISQLRTSVSQLEKDIQYFEAQNQKHQQTQIALSKSSESEYFRGKDLMTQESERRSLLQSRETEISSLKIEIEHIKHTNSKYVEDSHELQSSIEALNRHVALLTQQNYEVSMS